PSGATIATQRSALVNMAQRILFESPMDERQIIKAVEEVDFQLFLQKESRFGVRITRLRTERFSIDIEELQRKIGSKIWHAMKGRVTVDLDNPDVLFLGIIYGKRFFFGTYLASRDRRGFFRRRSPQRPFFVPSALHPKIARVMVNFSRVACGDSFLDPFCGTGGLLLEARALGCLPIGLDIDIGILAGCHHNLTHYKTPFFGIGADARSPPVRSHGIDAIATDPPYGRSSSTKGAEVEKLIQTSLVPLADLLKPRGYLCFAVPLKHYKDELIATKDFSITESYTMRIHRSLSRHIVVLQRK
ncbi:MAG: THUMP domain-containing protein, partial [Promethearchaeota archaeon]